MHSLNTYETLLTIDMSCCIDVMQAFKDTAEYRVQEQALGALAAMTLRNKVAVADCSIACVDVVLEIMATHKSSCSIQRHACIFIRNVVVHNTLNQVQHILTILLS